MNTKHLILLLLLIIGSGGCGTTDLYHTARGEQVLWSQGANLYRKKPYVLPAEGWVAVTKGELIFVPSIGIIGPIRIYGKDSTFIKLENIDRYEKKRWLLISASRLTVITKNNERYRFVVRKPDKLIQNINQIKEGTE